MIFALFRHSATVAENLPDETDISVVSTQHIIDQNEERGTEKADRRQNNKALLECARTVGSM